MAHVIVLSFLLLVGKNAVRFVDLLEFFFGPGFLADIRVIFPGEVAVRLLDLLLVRTPRYAEGLVVVSRNHSRLTLL